MQYPFFDFPFYHDTPDIDLRRIYPIGSIIFRSSPLADKTEWTDVSLFHSQLTVEWEGMTWELIVSIKPDDLDDPTRPWADFHSQVHSVRNVRLQYTRTQEELERGVCSAHMIIDDQNQGTFNLDTFTGENSHKLIEAEMPSHNHRVYAYWQQSSSGSKDGLVSARLPNGTSYSNAGYGNQQYVENKGGNQPHNNKEYAYNLFMYKRIA